MNHFYIFLRRAVNLSSCAYPNSSHAKVGTKVVSMSFFILLEENVADTESGLSFLDWIEGCYLPSQAY